MVVLPWDTSRGADSADDAAARTLGLPQATSLVVGTIPPGPPPPRVDAVPSASVAG
jgi:hypothetical protein